MDDLVLFYPEGHERHFEQGHPERPARVEAIWDRLQESGVWEVSHQVGPQVVPNDVLTAIHTSEYLAAVESASRSGRRYDADTYLTPASWELANNAAGGALAVAAEVWDRKAHRGFALTRPPGHHATPDQAMGFCLLNNVALAAEFILRHREASRLAIVDVDLHHGNGTQDIFYERGDVLYISTHQYPLYPGTGRLEHTGTGAGEMRTLNIPLPPYSGDEAMSTAYETIILPVLDRFSPDMLLVSAGFDSHWKDPLGHLLVTVEGYADQIKALVDLADQTCQGRIALFLEGGYDLEAGAACGLAATAALIGEDVDDHIGPAPWQEERVWQVIMEAGQRLWGDYQGFTDCD